MYLYNKSTDNLVNLTRTSRLTVIYRGNNSSGEVWSVIVFMAKSDKYMVLSDHSSKAEAGAALSQIADALEAGKPVYKV